MKGKILKVLTIVIILWVSITYYFITQHTILVKEAIINETFVFEDMTVEVHQFVLSNGERKWIDFEKENSRLRTRILTGLPLELASIISSPIMRLSFVYSRPYDFNNEIYHTALVGKISLHESLTNSQENFDYVHQHLRISIEDHIGYGYGSSRGLMQEEPVSDVYFSFHSDRFPIERLSGGFKLTVENTKSGQRKEIRLTADQFRNYEWNFTFGPVRSLDFLEKY